MEQGIGATNVRAGRWRGMKSKGTQCAAGTKGRRVRVRVREGAEA